MTRTTGSQTFPLIVKNTGQINTLIAAALGLLDTNASHFLRLVCGSDITADRNLTFTTGDAARTITLSGNPTLNDWFDQAVKAASSPTFAAIKLTTGAGSSKVLTSDADGDATWETPGAGGLPMGYATGLEATNAADADHDITVAVGKMRDTTNAYDLALDAAMTKQIDASWAAGTNQGGLFSGAVGSNTIYFKHLIRKDSDGSIDWGFDTSATAANIPAGYTAYAVMGYERTDGSANILASTETVMGNMVEKWFKVSLFIASGLTSTSWAAQSLSAVIPASLTQVLAYFGGIHVSDNPAVYLSRDGVSYMGSIPAMYSEEYVYSTSNFYPIVGNQIYYLRGSGTGSFTMLLRGVRYRR